MLPDFRCWAKCVVCTAFARAAGYIYSTCVKEKLSPTLDCHSEEGHDAFGKVPKWQSSFITWLSSFFHIYIYMHISYMCVHAFLLIHLYSSSSMPLFLLFFSVFLYIYWRRNNICVWWQWDSIVAMQNISLPTSIRDRDDLHNAAGRMRTV